MRINQIKTIITGNDKDFKKFDFIQAINPFAAPRTPDSGPRTSDSGNIPYGKQSITEQDVAAVCSVLRSDFITQGPKVPEFEQAVAEKVQARHAVAVNSGTSALHLACRALDIGPGDLVWTSPNTFVASANCARYCGADVDFVDIDPHTLNLSPQKLADKLERTRREGRRLPKVVIPVHFAGQACEMSKIADLAKEYGFRILEDASHAIGGRYRGEPVGSCRYSDIAVFSFHPVKIITTAEGGMAVTNNSELAARMERLRSHGITRDAEQMTGQPDGPWYYQQIELGYNYRMTELQAALGVSQLQRLNEFVARRHELARRYDNMLADLPITTPLQHPDSYSALHLYPVRLRLDKLGASRRKVFERLREQGIGVNVHYISVHTQPYYRALGFEPGMFPEAEKYYQEAITLPLFPSMNEWEQDKTVEAIEKAIKKQGGEQWQ